MFSLSRSSLFKTSSHWKINLEKPEICTLYYWVFNFKFTSFDIGTFIEVANQCWKLSIRALGMIFGDSFKVEKILFICYVNIFQLAFHRLSQIYSMQSWYLLTFIHNFLRCIHHCVNSVEQTDIQKCTPLALKEWLDQLQCVGRHNYSSPVAARAIVNSSQLLIMWLSLPVNTLTQKPLQQFCITLWGVVGKRPRTGTFRAGP